MKLHSTGAVLPPCIYNDVSTNRKCWVNQQSLIHTICCTIYGQSLGSLPHQQAQLPLQRPLQLEPNTGRRSNYYTTLANYNSSHDFYLCMCTLHLDRLGLDWQTRSMDCIHTHIECGLFRDKSSPNHNKQLTDSWGEGWWEDTGGGGAKAGTTPVARHKEEI